MSAEVDSHGRRTTSASCLIAGGPINLPRTPIVFRTAGTRPEIAPIR